jgi:hypothetical protein
MKVSVTTVAAVILIVVAAFAGGLWIAQHQTSNLATRLEAKLALIDQKATTTIAVQNTTIKDQAAQIAQDAAEKAKLQTENAEILADRETWRKKAEAAEAQLKTAPPEELLARTKELLNMTDIWLRSNAANQVEAVFSLTAFRANTIALEHGHYIEFTLVPSIQLELENTKAQLRTTEDQSARKDIQLAAKDTIISQKDDQIKGRDDLNAALKKANLWKELRDVGLGVLIDRILSIIFHK